VQGISLNLYFSGPPHPNAGVGKTPGVLASIEHTWAHRQR